MHFIHGERLRILNRFQADAFSLGDCSHLQDGNEIPIAFPAFERALKNRLKLAPGHEQLVQAHSLP